jgi:murein DD-endopeptidase MepM/ murein hydrolase activator NlpD
MRVRSKQIRPWAMMARRGERRLSVWSFTAVLGIFAALGASEVGTMAKSRSDKQLRGYDIRSTGLRPRYPIGYECSPLTSLYASWIDVDGSRRTEPHSGVDAGRLGDWILAPGPGTVRAAWRADWGWGNEGALLIEHSSQELNLDEPARSYYSEFDHIEYAELAKFKAGQKISRGERLAHVYRPGGNSQYLPEVHWEVWQIDGPDKLVWATNRSGGRYWINESARLVDPLYMLSRDTPPKADGGVILIPYRQGQDYTRFRGFTYILPCRPDSGP